MIPRPSLAHFLLQIRTVNIGGCKVDINGIVSLGYDPVQNLFTRWDFHYDDVWENRSLYGKCLQN
jgi:hypothetical protein